MLRMPNCTLTPERQDYHIGCGKLLKSSYTLMNSFDHSNYIALRTAIATRFLDGSIDSANREELIEIPIVPKDTDDNDCTEYLSKLVLDYLDRKSVV